MLISAGDTHNGNQECRQVSESETGGKTNQQEQTEGARGNKQGEREKQNENREANDRKKEEKGKKRQRLEQDHNTYNPLITLAANCLVTLTL